MTRSRRPDRRALFSVVRLRRAEPYNLSRGDRMQVPWKRFWISKGGTTRRDHEGFLLDPERFRDAQADAVSTDQLTKIPCLVLLGEPGIGKTTELRRMASDLPGVVPISLNLSAYSDQSLLNSQLFESPEFRSWLNSDQQGEIRLDGLDEGLLLIKAVATWLAESLQKCPANRLRLRIACRTAEWPALLENALRSTWGSGDADVGVFELAPLRRCDVEEAARTRRVNTKRFMDEILDRGLGPLATKPTTLRFLLDAYEKHGALPGTAAELYEIGCRRLAAEHELSSRSSSGTQSKFTPERLVAVSERIAAACVFGRKSSIALESPRGVASPDVLYPSEVVGKDICESGRVEQVGDDAVRDALRCGLFSGHSQGSVAFAHWTYGEFLAAKFCCSRRLTVDQMFDLVSVEGREGVREIAPQLSQVTSWIAVMNRQFLGRVLEMDPALLLRGWIGGTSSEIRAAIVTAILSRAERAEHFDDQRHFGQYNYAALNHAGLSTQLTPYILEPAKGIVARRIAIDIAEACQVKSLLPVLERVAMQRNDDHHIRTEAVHAIVEIGGAPERARLRPLLDSPKVEDPHDEIRGALLRSMWPDDLTVLELFSHLTPAHDQEFHGAYDRFLAHELSSMLDPAGLVAALNWTAAVEEQNPDWHTGQKFTEAVMLESLKHIEAGGVAPALANVVSRRLRKLRCPFTGFPNPTTSPLAAMRLARRRIAEMVVPMLAVQSVDVVWTVLHPGQLLDSADFEWVLTRLDASPNLECEDAWADLAVRMYNASITSQTEQLQDAVKRNEALANRIGGLFEPIELGSAVARELKQNWEKYRADRSTCANHPPMETLVTQALDLFDSGDDRGWWWALHRSLSLRPDSDAYDNQAFFWRNLDAFPGWQELTGELKLRCIGAAAKYLLRADPCPEQWLGKDVIHYPAVAGYRALSLLYKYDRAMFDSIQPRDWERWAPAVIGFPHSSDSDGEQAHLELVRIAYDSAPTIALHVARTLLDKACGGDGYVGFLGSLKLCWDQSLTNLLVERLQDTASLGPNALAELLGYTLALGDPAAFDLAMRVVESHGIDDRHRAAAATAAVELVTNMPRESWASVWDVMAGHDDFAIEVIDKLLNHRGDFRAEGIVKVLPERSVAELWIWLERHYPSAEIRWDDNESLHGTEREIAWLRDGLPARLSERGTPEATAAIQWLIDQRPDNASLKFHLHQSKVAVRRASWSGTPLATVFAMVDHPDVRPIESNAQLLAAVTKSLERLQERLQIAPAAVGDLWNESTPKSEEELSDYVARHLSEDLKSWGAMACREAQVRRGQFSDILITATARGATDGRVNQLQAVVEVKGCWHRELKTAMKTQLVDRYLTDHPTGTGMYLVGWFACETWSNTDSRKKGTPKMSLDDARQLFESQVRDLCRPGVLVSSFVLDARIQDPKQCRATRTVDQVVRKRN